MEQKKEKRRKLLLIILIFITLAAMCVTVWALFFRDKNEGLTPDYAPQETEANAEPIEGDDNTKLEQPEGGGAVSLTYSKDVTVSLSDKTAGLLFANPGKSNQDMVVQLIIQDTVIVQSGTLKPGSQVTTLNLLDGAEQTLSEGTYEGKFNILFYDPDTGEKAIVNTEIPVTVNVSK